MYLNRKVALDCSCFLLEISIADVATTVLLASLFMSGDFGPLEQTLAGSQF